MNKCIYSLSENESFKKQEHIVPAFLGGKQKLENGVVSDETNELFSKMESQLSHSSGISALRDIHGPGKRGKSKFEGRPLLANYDKKPSFFISMSNNKMNVIDQIIITSNEGKYSVHFGLKENTNLKKSLIRGVLFRNEFYKIKRDERYTFIEDPLGKKNRYVVTHFKGKWYISSRNHIDLFKVMYKLRTGKLAKVDSYKPEVISIKKGITISRVAKDETQSYRTHAKILFNVFAMFYGQKIAFDKQFNDIRHFVYNGIVNQSIQGNFDGMIDINRLVSKFKISKMSHIFLIIENEKGITGVSSFYGGAYITSFNLSRKKAEVKSLRIFVVDWKKSSEAKIVIDKHQIEKYLLSHESASREEYLNPVKVFDRKIPKNIGKVIRETLPNLESKRVIIGFNSKTLKNFSQIGRINELKTYYIDIDRTMDDMSFFGTLLQGVLYVKWVDQSKGYACIKNKNENGSKYIANYINYLSTFSIVSKEIIKYGYNLDIIYDRRLNQFVTNYLKGTKKNKFNSYLRIRYIIESCILISYNQGYKQSLVELFGEFYSKIDEQIDLVLQLINRTGLKDLTDRTEFLLCVIGILEIKNHIIIKEQ